MAGRSNVVEKKNSSPTKGPVEYVKRCTYICTPREHTKDAYCAEKKTVADNY